MKFVNGSHYIDCDVISYQYTAEYAKECGLGVENRYGSTQMKDYVSKCNNGLWRDGCIGNMLLKLKSGKTDALHVYKDSKEILVITRDTPKELYSI